MALVITTVSVWLSTFAYAHSPATKQTILTLSVIFFVGMLLTFGTMARFSEFMRTFVFTSANWNHEANQKSMGIVLYALSLLAAHFIWR